MNLEAPAISLPVWGGHDLADGQQRPLLYPGQIAQALGFKV
jgi:hypothetical protein